MGIGEKSKKSIPLTDMWYINGRVESLPLTNMRYISGWVESIVLRHKAGDFSIMRIDKGDHLEISILRGNFIKKNLIEIFVNL